MVVWLVGRFANRPYVRLDGCMDGEGWVCWLVWLVGPSLPGPSPQPSPVQRERGNVCGG